MKSALIFLLLWLTICGSVWAQNCSPKRYQDTIFSNVTVTNGVYFGTATPYGLLAQPQDLYLDIYEPTGDTLSQRPLIIFQFGGGFAIGWRSEPVIPDFCTYFAKCGYTVASIDYRLGFNLDSQSTVRAMYRAMQDERAAIRFLCQRANQFRIDTGHIFLTGTSAGCFSALGNIYMNELDRPAPTYGIFLEPDDLGCMDCSGNNDFGNRIPRIKGFINQWGAILDTSLIEPHETTPVISFHGDQDLLVPYEYGFPFQLPVFPPVYGSKPIHQRLTNLGIKNELRPLVGYGHEPELLNAHLNDTIRTYSRQFLFEIMQPQTPSVTGPTATCKSSVCTYYVTANNGSRYCWQLLGNGQVIENTGNKIKVLWADTGNMQLAVKEISRFDAEGTTSYFQTLVIPDAAALFNYQADELQVSFTNLSAFADTFQWNFGDGSFSAADNPVNQYNSPGNYTATLIARNAYCADTAYTSFVIDSCPVALFTSQIVNFNGFFNAHPTNTNAYQWYFGDGDSALITYPNVFHQYTQSGTYAVVLQVSNVLGCRHTDTIYVTVTPTVGLPETNIKPFIQNKGNHIYAVEAPQKEVVLIGVFNTEGKAVIEQTVNTPYTLSLQHLPAGLYVISARLSNQAPAIIKVVR